MNEAEFNELLENIKQNKIYFIPIELVDKINSGTPLTLDQTKLLIEALKINQSIIICLRYFNQPLRDVMQSTCERNFSLFLNKIRQSTFETFEIYDHYKYIDLHDRKKIIIALGYNVSIVKATGSFPNYYIDINMGKQYDVNAALEICIARNKAAIYLKNVNRNSTNLIALLPEDIQVLMENYTKNPNEAADSKINHDSVMNVSSPVDKLAKFIRTAMHLNTINFPETLGHIKLSQEALFQRDDMKSLLETLMSLTRIFEISINHTPIFQDICDNHYAAWLQEEQGKTLLRNICNAIPTFPVSIIMIVLNYKYALNQSSKNEERIRNEAQILNVVKTVHAECSNLFKKRDLLETQRLPSGSNLVSMDHDVLFTPGYQKRKQIKLKSLTLASLPIADLQKISIEDSNNTDSIDRRYNGAKEFVADFLNQDSLSSNLSFPSRKPKDPIAGSKGSKELNLSDHNLNGLAPVRIIKAPLPLGFKSKASFKVPKS